MAGFTHDFDEMIYTLMRQGMAFTLMRREMITRHSMQ